MGVDGSSGHCFRLVVYDTADRCFGSDREIGECEDCAIITGDFRLVIHANR